MKSIICVAASETFSIFQTEGGMFCCPVCGSPELEPAPYNENGHPAFIMCSCGFEFGFDDSPDASPEAVEGIQNNWKRWRRILINQAATNKSSLDKLENQLKNIKIRLAFDLIDVPDEV